MRLIQAIASSRPRERARSRAAIAAFLLGLILAQGAADLALVILRNRAPRAAAAATTAECGHCGSACCEPGEADSCCEGPVAAVSPFGALRLAGANGCPNSRPADDGYFPVTASYLFLPADAPHTRLWPMKDSPSTVASTRADRAPDPPDLPPKISLFAC